MRRFGYSLRSRACIAKSILVLLISPHFEWAWRERISVRMFVQVQASTCTSMLSGNAPHAYASRSRSFEVRWNNSKRCQQLLLWLLTVCLISTSHVALQMQKHLMILLNDRCAETFNDFVERSLFPHLMPFDGTSTRSVVILDNTSIHRCDGVVELIDSAGTLVIFLQPYSLDLNPIEKPIGHMRISSNRTPTHMNFRKLWCMHLLVSL